MQYIGLGLQYSAFLVPNLLEIVAKSRKNDKVLIVRFQGTWDAWMHCLQS